MRSWLLLLPLLLIAGGVNAETVRGVVEGESFQLFVLTLSSTVTRCYLQTPTGQLIEFIPDNNENEKYQRIDTIPFSGCAVVINNADKNDSGIWVLSSELGAETRREKFSVTVAPQVSENAKEDDDNIKRLSPINYVARIGLNITVSLSKLVYGEDCYLRTPEGNILTKDENFTAGVNFHSSSDFVSCRVVIGPMDATLLGEWALCGKHTANNVEHERCQSANIVWNNNNAPNQLWQSEQRPSFDHVVNFGGTLTPEVRGTGNINTCHIITPNGEDLVITPDSEYPLIRRTSSGDSICSVAIGPIQESLLGDWVIYGTFSSATIGFNEMRFPMHLHLYDINNPYDQAYNVSTLPMSYNVVNLGNTIDVQVASTGVTDACYYKTPTGQSYNQTTSENMNAVTFIDVGSSAACHIAVGPISEEMLGEWQLTGKFSNNGVYSEIQQLFQIIREDPENPMEDPNRTIENMTEEFISTEIGVTHRVALNVRQHNIHESCHIRTPDGLQYTIMEGFSIPGVQVIEESVEACVVSITAFENLIGNWTLISRETRLGLPVERRLPFTIYVEEQVNALPTKAVIAEGNDLYIRLENPTNLSATCEMIPPNEFYINAFSIERDENYIENCGFIVRDIQTNGQGQWEIVYGNKIIYRASTTVTVIERSIVPEISFIWIRDRPVEQVMGPVDAVYCRVEDPSGLVVFEGFGRCKIDLERVRLEYAGSWKMTVGSPGRVLTEEQNFSVVVQDAERNQFADSLVEHNEPDVMLRCFMPVDSEVTACKFRMPSGQVLLASHGVGEDRYSFHGVGVSLHSEVKSYECGLRITNPVVEDLGLWRCAVDTDTETYYGFLSVFIPWAMQDSDFATAVELEPILRADSSSVSVIEEESIRMTCSVQSAIKYCYFRAQNGTVFNVSPGSTSPEYVGAGFTAGECGIRFPGVMARDSGNWSCHVGFHDLVPEQRAQINVVVTELMVVNVSGSWPGRVLIEAIIHDERHLEYCRFVRTDGFGFGTENTPSGYESSITDHIYNKARCHLSIANPSTLDASPWTVIAKIYRKDVEISRVTPSFVVRAASRKNFAFAWSIIILITLMMLVLGLMLRSKTSREWTAYRAATIRGSFGSFYAKPATPVIDERNTATAA